MGAARPSRSYCEYVVEMKMMREKKKHKGQGRYGVSLS